MNPTEHRLTERLVETGRLSAQTLMKILEGKPDGAGLIDTLLLQDVVTTQDVELLLAELAKDGPEPEADDLLLRSVKRLDRYVILGTLGRGGAGRVYLAYDTKLKRSVALKAMRIERTQDLLRFRREVEIASSFHHPNIAAVHDAESVDDVFIIAMQYVEGQPLDRLRVSPREAMEAGAQAARALQAAHERGIIHRDLKPGNLMRAPDGRLYLLDFGIARPAGGAGAVTQSGGLIGTPAYMSPEQAQGRPLDARTDIYSLGATLYSLVTQHVPFEGTTALEVVRRVASETPPPPRRFDPELDRGIELIILKAMSRDPSHRYASARELAEDIEAFLAGEPIRARPLSVPARTIHYLKRRPWAVATLATIVLGIAASGGVFLGQQRHQARLSEARGLTERAGRAIDQYDQLLHLPPQDLTPYRSLLEEASSLSRRALATAGDGQAGAHLQLARAAIRRGDEVGAERAINRAVELDPSGSMVVERIRIRLGGLKRSVVNVADLVSEQLMEPWRAPRLNVPIRMDGPFRQALIDDFDRAGASSADARSGSALLRALDEAIRGRLALAEETAQESMRKLPLAERAEFSAVLALVEYLAYVEVLEGAQADKLDFSLSDHLDRAIAHVTRALEIRESDPDLYLMRALLHLGRGAIPLRVFQGSYPTMYSADRGALKARWRRTSELIRPELPRIESWLRECAERAKRDLDTAVLIRPDNAEAHLIYPSVHALFISPPQLVQLADEWAAQEVETPLLPFFIKVAALYKSYEKSFFVPAKESCRRAIELNPRLPLAWTTMAWLSDFELGYANTINPRGTAKLQEETLKCCARTLELAPEPRLEAMVRGIQARVHLHRVAVGQGDRDEERRKAQAEIEILKRLDPGMAGRLLLLPGAAPRNP